MLLWGHGDGACFVFFKNVDGFRTNHSKMAREIKILELVSCFAGELVTERTMTKTESIGSVVGSLPMSESQHNGVDQKIHRHRHKHRRLNKGTVDTHRQQHT